MGGEGGLDLGAMMQMAQDMSERMGDAQSELAEARVEGSAGGGLVKVVLNGHLHLLEVVIEPTAVDPEDPSILGDLIVAAWRDAHDDVARLQAAADPLGGLGGALGGGLGDLFGGG
ncbi:MAG: YbaB/EbfC family nucleoid-associated protein [Microthrixaceae bacterium]|nr:YbaB/EbfC family nucleoid-associated protein [Microthrixaceae bacterium]